jgi:hypothetical protein
MLSETCTTLPAWWCNVSCRYSSQPDLTRIPPLLFFCLTGHSDPVQSLCGHERVVLSPELLEHAPLQVLPPALRQGRRHPGSHFCPAASRYGHKTTAERSRRKVRTSTLTVIGYNIISCDTNKILINAMSDSWRSPNSLSSFCRQTVRP